MADNILTAGTGENLDAIIARNALKYDLLPYNSNPFPQTHPARLRGLAQLFGLKTTPVSGARILELGCAAGGNIIPLAALYPNAHFVGVDLSRTQVSAGRARIAELGLTNIEIRCQSFTELTNSDGLFDYIICHGVYSWVPAPVRDAVLRICSDFLSPTGVAIISYNVLPGWRMLQPLRDAFLMQMPSSIDPRTRVTAARQLLTFLNNFTTDNGAYKRSLSDWAERLARVPDDYIAHEFLEETNEPCTFREFLDAAARHKLGFLAESDLPSMIVDNLPAETAAQLRAIAGDQLGVTEQYLDLITARTFRQSILISETRMGEIKRNLSGESIVGQHLLSGGDLKIIETSNGGCVMSDSAGRQISSDSSAVRAALEKLKDNFPSTSSVDALLEGAGDEAAQALVRDALFKMCLIGMVIVTSEPVSALNKAPKRPVAIKIARADAERGEMATTNLRHERVAFDALGQLVLPLLDGTLDQAGIVDAVVKQIAAGKLQFARDGVAVTDPHQRELIAVEQVKAVLPAFARAALLAD